MIRKVYPVIVSFLLLTISCQASAVTAPMLNHAPPLLTPEATEAATASSISAPSTITATSRSTSTAASTLTPVPTPTTSPTAVPAPIHAMRLDFTNYEASRAEVARDEQLMRAAGINMVNLGAGRVEWTYFKWAGHEANWSNDVKDTGIDFLAEDSTRFKQWAQVDAVIDVLSPNYIRAHPDKAAVSFGGVRSTDLVSTAELTHGQFGQDLLAMIDYVAANYPVDSISITELFYHSDGFGPDDKALYLAYTSRQDWPRLTDGTIDHNDVSIGNWRTHELDVYLDQAVAIAHKYDKQLFLDVGLSTDFGTTLEALERVTNEHGTNYNVVLEHMDKIVIWGYFALDEGFPTGFFQDIGQFLGKFGRDRVILSIGLWGRSAPSISANDLENAILASQAGGTMNFWITPITLMSAADWQVLDKLWGIPSSP